MQDFAVALDQCSTLQSTLQTSLSALAVALAAAPSSRASKAANDACREQLARLRRAVDALELAAESAAELTELAARRRAFDVLRAAVRDAALAAHKAARDEAHAQRTALLAGSPSDAQPEAGAAAEAATASLRRTRALMTAELGRGAATLTQLGASTATLRAAGSEFSGQKATLSSGRRLLGAVARSAHADALVLWGGALFFALVVLHITFKRTPGLAALHPLHRRPVWQPTVPPPLPAVLMAQQDTFLPPPSGPSEPAASRGASLEEL